MGRALFICGTLKFIVYKFKSKKFYEIEDSNPPFVAFEPVLMRNSEMINDTLASP